MLLILLAISLSLDALAVSFSYGLRGVYIPLASRLIICLLSTLYFAAACLFGHTMQQLLPGALARFFSIALLAALCVWMTIQTLLTPRPDQQLRARRTLASWSLRSLGVTITIIRDPMLADLDDSHTIDSREAIYLASALSMDALGMGISYAVYGAFSWLAPLAVGLFQFVFTSAGHTAGHLCAKKTAFPPGKLQIISCCVLWAVFLLRLLG